MAKRNGGDLGGITVKSYTSFLCLLHLNIIKDVIFPICQIIDNKNHSQLMPLLALFVTIGYI